MESTLFAHRGPIFLVALAALAGLLGGCAVDPFARIDLGATSAPAVRSAFGAEARDTDGGCTVAVGQQWPTVVGFVHAHVPEQGRVDWKVSFRGSVIHMVTFQTLNLKVVYEGPLSEALVNGLRAPDPEKANEFAADLVGFLDQRVRVGMTEPWSDPKALEEDRTCSRFLGLYEFSLSGLRGRGKLSRERFAAQIDAPGARLVLDYLGDEVYQLAMRGTVSLKPFPIL